MAARGAVRKFMFPFVPIALVLSLHAVNEFRPDAVCGTKPMAVAMAGQETVTALELAVAIWSVGRGVNADASR